MSNRSAVSVRKKPTTNEPVTFINRVPRGKRTGKRSATTPPNQNRATTPSAPQKPTTRYLTKDHLRTVLRQRAVSYQDGRQCPRTPPAVVYQHGRPYLPTRQTVSTNAAGYYVSDVLEGVRKLLLRFIRT